VRPFRPAPTISASVWIGFEGVAVMVAPWRRSGFVIAVERFRRQGPVRRSGA